MVASLRMLSGVTLALALSSLALGCGPADDGSPGPDPEPEARSWRDEVIYQLLTDRFANGRTDNDASGECETCYLGGDWAGILERLDYLDELGVTAIWISPIAENVDGVIGDGYHGFWPLAHDRPNPRFGTEDELRALVDACHDRGIKVIVDVVLNHMGPVFYYDLDGNGELDDGEMTPSFASEGIDAPVVFEGGVSPAGFANPDWYNRRGLIENWDDPDQALRGDFTGGLRDLDTSRDDVRQALLDVTLDWLERVPFDGIRFDAAKHVEDDFWPWFLAELRAAHPNMLTVAEAFDGNVSRLASFTENGGFDTVLDFSAKYQGFDSVFVGGAPTSALRDLHVTQQSGFPDTPHPGGTGVAPRDLLLRFLDNHDVPRYGSMLGEEGVRAALAYLMTADGVPVVYYGTEHDFVGAEDPANREVLWDTDYRQDGMTYQWLRRLGQIRADHDALRRGDLRFVWTSERSDSVDGGGLVAFERTHGDERVLVVINTRGASATTASGGVGMAVGFSPGTALAELLVGGDPIEVPADSRLEIEIPAYGARVYAAQ